MLQGTAEFVMAEIAALPIEERVKLAALMMRNGSGETDLHQGIFVPPFDAPDPAPSVRWIEEHRQEYASQYVALDGDRLIASSHDAQEVIAAVRASGVAAPFFTLIPPVDALPFAGF